MMHKIQSLIGISLDEAQRMKDSRIPWMENLYPLIDDLGWARMNCWEYLQSFNLGEPPKSACYVCPYRSDESWLNMKEKDPDAFESACNFERKVQEMDGRREYKGVPFLHRAMVPLAEVDFAARINKPEFEQPSLFGDECEGMCGV